MSMYYDLCKYIATEVIDVDVDCEFIDGALEIDVHIKIPIAKSIEDTYNSLTGP